MRSIAVWNDTDPDLPILKQAKTEYASSILVVPPIFSLVKTETHSLVCMTQREIPSNCGNLHNSALHIWSLQCRTLGGLRATWK